jgi:hypothetical protein
MSDVPRQLVGKLDEFVASLRAHDQEHWAQRMELARSEIAAGDPHGVDRILGAYGGMGSINDLPLPFDHGVIALSGEVYGLASSIRAGRSDPCPSRARSDGK